ncbi:MAG: hypothetical protein WC586_11865 [Methanoregula sp.]
MQLRNLSIVLLALLLAAMAMVPMVSAAEEQTPAPGSTAIPPDIDPNYHPIRYGILDEPPFAKVTKNPNDNKEQIEFVYVLVSKDWLATNGLTDSNGSVTFSIPHRQVHFVKQQAGSPAHVPTDFLGESSSLADRPLSVIWAPKNLLRVQEKGESVSITCPQAMLLNFNNMKETKSKLESAKNENLLIPEVPADSSAASAIQRAASISSTSLAERRFYSDYFNLHRINGVTGKMQPAGFSNSGESFFSYHEMELYLQQPTDAVEYIVYHRTDGRIIDFVSVHDDYALSTPLTMDVTDLSTYLEWYFYIENGPVWYMHFRNPISGTWYTASHTDTVNMSRYVTQITPSTELYLNSVPPSHYFYTQTSPFQADWTRTVGWSGGNEWHTPQETTSAGSLPANNQYLQLTSNWDTSGRIVTTQVCGSSVV